jgi:hypothetical protein
VAWSARILATTGHYEASRFPGYPIEEFVSALLWRGGPWALNGASALFSALAAGCFALILRRLGSRDDWIAALALASAPAFYIASVQAMDYAWSLALALAALYAALAGRATWAGALLGLAIGCRLTNGAWLVPIALALSESSPRQERARRVVTCAVIVIAVGALAFVPVFVTYGPGFFRFYQRGYPQPMLLAKHLSVDLWGIPGTIALLVGLIWTLVRRPSRTSITSRSTLLTLAWASGIALYAVSYLRLPIKAFYLIPLVPCVLLLAARYFERRVFLAVCMALIVSPWVLKVSLPGRIDAPASAASPRPVHVMGGTFLLDVFRGPLVTEQQRRTERERYVGESIARTRALRDSSVVIATDWLSQIRVHIGGKEDRRVRYVDLPDSAEVRALQSRGLHIYYLGGAEWETQRVHGFDLHSLGAQPLDDEDAGRAL